MDKDRLSLIKEYINGSSNVFIMSHMGIDLDGFGACLALLYICRGFNKNCYLVVDDDKVDSTIEKSVIELKNNGLDVNLYKSTDVVSLCDDNSLLFIVDVHKKKMVSASNLIDIVNNVIVIDHHLSKSDVIPGVVNYINSSYTSSVEIVVSMVLGYGVKLPALVCTIMLAGISVDTNNFTLKTNKNTYSCASMLTDWGADGKIIQSLLKEDLSEYFNIQKNISNVFMINDSIAICVCDEEIYDKEFLAKIASTILGFDGIEVSFTIGRISDSIIGVSCRSVGNMPASNYMEKLGGGGHINDAAAQIKDKTINEIKEELLNILKEE